MIAADVIRAGRHRLESLLFRPFLALVERHPARRVAREAAAEVRRFEVDAAVREERRERHDDAAADRRMALQLEPVDRLRPGPRGCAWAAARPTPSPRTRRCRAARRAAWSWTNALAAACAAAMRVGSTSAARMLSDTSIARMIVCWFDGSVTVAVGRAMAMIAAIVASRNSAGGTWRRMRWVRPIACMDQAQAGVADRASLLPPQQQHVRADHRRYGEKQPQHLRPQERHRALPPAACPRAMRRAEPFTLALTGQPHTRSPEPIIAPSPARAVGRNVRPRAPRNVSFLRSSFPSAFSTTPPPWRISCSFQLIIPTRRPHARSRTRSLRSPRSTARRTFHASRRPRWFSPAART